MKKPLEFKARKEIVNGKEVLTIDPIPEVIKHDDGIGQNVIMHMPSLSLINQCKLANGIE
jgi:hypothetical protein